MARISILGAMPEEVKFYNSKKKDWEKNHEIYIGITGVGKINSTLLFPSLVRKV